jgi:TRAP transporter TAXI family solute receptor
VANGSADFTIAAADAVETYELGDNPGADQLRGVARLYDDYVQLVVPRDSGIESVADLKGKRVAIGPPSSGVRLIADRVLKAAGIDATKDITPFSDGIDTGPEQLKQGKIDAFFWSGGLPTPGVDELARRMPLRLLDLPALADPVYRAATIPSGTYGLGSQVSTLAVPNLLIARDDCDPALAALVTATLFERRGAIARAVPAAAALDRRAAIETAPVALHPAALDWFRATKP